jgi:hypothetical protein
MGLTRRGSATQAEEPKVALDDGSIVEPSQTQMQAWSEGVSNNNEGDVRAALQSREIIDLSEMSSRSPSSHWRQRLRPASLTRKGSGGQSSVATVDSSTNVRPPIHGPSQSEASPDETAVSYAGAHLPVPDDAEEIDGIDLDDSISLDSGLPRQQDEGVVPDSQSRILIRLMVFLWLRRRSRGRERRHG